MQNHLLMACQYLLAGFDVMGQKEQRVAALVKFIGSYVSSHTDASSDAVDTPSYNFCRGLKGTFLCCGEEFAIARHHGCFLALFYPQRGLIFYHILSVLKLRATFCIKQEPTTPNLAASACMQKL